MQDTRRDNPLLLDSLLASPSPSTRAAAALTAGRLGGIAHLTQLRTLAGDSSANVAAQALFALSLLHDSLAVPLAERALSRELPVAVEGAWLLGELGTQGRTTLVRALATSDMEPDLRGALLLAAARLRPVPVADVARWLTSTDSSIAWRAAYALARTRNPAAVRLLLSVASSRVALVREQAARGLSKGSAGDSLASLALPPLQRLALDASPHVRVNAVRSLASYGHVAADAVQRALHDSDPAVRLTAAQTLGLVLDSASAPWSAAFALDTAFVVQRALAEGAASHGTPIPQLAAWRRGDWQHRATAAELDALGPALVALPRAEGWTHDADGRVRASAVAAIARLADSAATRQSAHVALTALLTDQDDEVRNTANAALDSSATSRRLGSTPDAPGGPQTRDIAWYRARAREALAPVAPRARMETERGAIELMLFSADAPLTVYNFDSLARAGYFNGQRFHRVVPGFVAQAGDPRGDGNGGPGYAIRDEINTHRYLRGTLGMALSGPNTGGSQFFITLSPQPHLDGGYTVFGQLLSGGDTLDRIVQGDRIVRITIH